MLKKSSYGLNPAYTKKKGYRWFYLFFVIVLALAGMSYATQDVAAFLAYQKVLGRPWFIWSNISWYAPWSVFIWYQKWVNLQSYFESSITAGQLIFLVPQLIILGCWFAHRRLEGNDSLHGSARWATEDDIQNMGYFGNSGVYIGGWLRKFTAGEIFRMYFHAGIQIVTSPIMFFISFFFKRKSSITAITKEINYYLRDNNPTHVLVFAPTRSGKGVGLILPTLLSWPHSSLVLDIKGENWALTSGWCQSIGNTTLRFEPSDASGAGACFNPLEEIPLETLLAIKETQNLAMMLIDPDGKGLSDHWTKAAFAFFSGLILHCCVMTPYREKRSATLTDLIFMMSDETRTTDELLQEMLETDHESIIKEKNPNSDGADHIHAFIASSAREMLNKDEKESSGVLSSAIVNLSLYRDPIIAKNIAKSDFRINDLMNHEKPVNLYLVVSPADQDRVKPLMRLIVDMIVRRVTEKMEFKDGSSVVGYNHKLLMLLDEFTSLGKLPIIEKAIAFAAGYGVKMYIIVQDIVQLTATYGKENGIMSNCHIRIAYAPNQIETAKMLSEMTGKTTVVETKTSLSGSRVGNMKNASLSVSETARPLLTSDECMRLPGISKDKFGKPIPGDMLIFTAGQPTIYGKQILYFQDPVFSKRSKIKAPGVSPDYPAGITDSLYYPRPKVWFSTSDSNQKNQPELSSTEDENLERFFCDRGNDGNN